MPRRRPYRASFAWSAAAALAVDGEAQEKLPERRTKIHIGKTPPASRFEAKK